MMCSALLMQAQQAAQQAQQAQQAARAAESQVASLQQQLDFKSQVRLLCIYAVEASTHSPLRCQARLLELAVAIATSKCPQNHTLNSLRNP